MKILIIPSAKLISEDLQSQFGKIPMVLMPINGRRILEIIYENYNNNVDEIIIVSKERSEKIIQIVKSNMMNVTLLKLDEIKDLGHSINTAVKYINDKYKDEKIEKVIINLADTIVEDLNIDSLSDTLVYSKTNDCKRWTTFEFEGNKILNIYDKKDDIESIEYNSFVGIYSFSNFDILTQCLNNSEETTMMDSFYKAILDYNKQIKFAFINTDKWFDIGHLDKYLKSKKDVKTRYFNTINIDKKRGILTKKSTEKQKFYNEILWYLRLPNKIQYIAPRVLNYSLEYENLYVSMEYYGYTTLNELFVFGDLNEDSWENILQSIFCVVGDMREYSLNLKNEEVVSSINEMYLNKTVDRLEMLRNDVNFKEFFNNNILINNKEYKSLSYYLNNLKNLLNEYNIYDINCFNVIHGDLCFSNILYDMQTGIVRLIDPRGTFGSYDIYGDTRYDIAKLSHSINGKYDYIINDLFDIEINENSINYRIFTNENMTNLQTLFENFITKYNFDSNQIKLIEALLFLSMIPLHKDYPRRQYAMLATGVKLIEELF